MVGGGPEKPVHWRKMRRIAGPEVDVAEAIRVRAAHDVQRFLIQEFRGHKKVNDKYWLTVK